LKLVSIVCQHRHRHVAEQVKVSPILTEPLIEQDKSVVSYSTLQLTLLLIVGIVAQAYGI
jgi:hypothetical protein